MRTTVTIDEELMIRAAELTGITERSVLLREGLEALIRIESARRLAALGGSDPQATTAGWRRELALGSIKDRGQVLTLLRRLRPFPRMTHAETLELVERRHLWGRGLSAVDAHLLGSTALVPGAQLWTRDKGLLAACREVGVAALEAS